MDNLEKAVIKTIIYYDIFDYPLTVVELWQWLWKYKCKLSELVFCLENGEDLRRQIETKNGFYFLKGRKDLLNTRKTRRDYSVNKWKIALKATKFLRTIPFIKTIMLCNSIAYFNAEKDSDIDFFIIVKEKYLWLTRFLITSTLHILRLRRHGNKINNRICLSFYITDNNLDLEKLYNKNNMYLHAWIKDLVPIFDRDTYANLWVANNWIKNYIPNIVPIEIINNWIVKDNNLTVFIRNFQETILDNIFGISLNFIFKKIQLMKMSLNKKSRRQEKNDCVIINDQILKFHEAGLEKINKLLSQMRNV
jgi:hypothetical protein